MTAPTNDRVSDEDDNGATAIAEAPSSEPVPSTKPGAHAWAAVKGCKCEGCDGIRGHRREHRQGSHTSRSVKGCTCSGCEKIRAERRESWKNDPALRDAATQKQKKRRRDDPEFRARDNARRSEQYHNDPEKETRLAKKREDWASDPNAKKAADSREAERLKIPGAKEAKRIRTRRASRKHRAKVRDVVQGYRDWRALGSSGPATPEQARALETWTKNRKGLEAFLARKADTTVQPRALANAPSKKEQEVLDYLKARSGAWVTEKALRGDLKNESVRELVRRLIAKGFPIDKKRGLGYHYTTSQGV
jgi:hypothetical protein